MYGIIFTLDLCSYCKIGLPLGPKEKPKEKFTKGNERVQGHPVYKSMLLNVVNV